MSKSARTWICFLGVCAFLSFVGCGKAKQETTDASSASAPAASTAKIYSLEDIDTELKDGQVVLGGTHDNVRAFYASHANYHVCKDDEAFTVAVVWNHKVDKHADDQYVVTNYNRDGSIGAMETGPPQFSVGNLASYCR
jgi:hypothetical protein